MRALHFAVAVLLVTAPAVGGTLAVDPTADPAAPSAETAVPAVERAGDAERARNRTALNHTPSVLAIPAGELLRSTHRKQHADIGPAVEFASNASSATLETRSTVERIENIEATERREQALQTALDRIERRSSNLHQRERAAIEAYGAGEIRPRTLLIRLARVDIEARELEHRRKLLADLGTRTDGVDLDQARLAALERRIDALTGPVRARAVAVLQAKAPNSRFYVAAGPNSVVLTAIVDGSYVREAFRGNRYNSGSEDISPEAALDIAAESYPVIWQTRRNNTEVTGSSGNYLVTIPHARGVLTAFVDGGSETVYKEFQRRSLETVNDAPPVSSAKDGLRLTVNRTYPGGPLHVRLEDVETGEPVDANVTIGQGDRESELLGRTGGDGNLWTLSPGGQYTITAIRGNSVVVLTVQPAAPPRVGGTDSNSSS